MSAISNPAAAELKLEKATILGCDDMLELLKHEESNSTINLKRSLGPLFVSTGEKFLPDSIYVREEMREVFKELTKTDRKSKQVLIGSPGVGKSILLFLVAIYRALTEGKPCCFIRMTEDSRELTSVFVFFKETNATAEAKAGTLTVHYNRKVSPNKSAENIVELVLNRLFHIPSEEALSYLVDDKAFLFMDGLHKGDNNLNIPHHYLSTNGGYDSPHGESQATTSLVVLGGWQKEALFKGLQSTVSGATGTNEPEAEDEKNRFDDIYYHTGGANKGCAAVLKESRSLEDGKEGHDRQNTKR